MAGYCTLDQVTSAFPQFDRDQYGSISDDDIQGWINDCKSRIRSAFLTRGYDPDSPPNGALAPDSDPANFLRALNRDGAIAELGDALQGAVTLQPGEYSLAQARRRSFERIIKEIKEAMHDRLFQSGPLGNVARTQDVEPLFGGIAGAETSRSDTPSVLGTNRLFGKNDTF